MQQMITITNPKTGEPISYPAPKPAIPDIDNTELVTNFRAAGGMILHVRPRKRRFEDNRVTRGMTLAFEVRSGHIVVATSVQHRSDCFSKKMGTKLAIEHFLAGKTITLPVKPGQGVVMTLQLAFNHVV